MYMIRRKPPDVSGAGLLLRGPPLSPGVVRGVGTTSRDPLPRAPLSVGASAAEWEILDGKRVDLQSGAPGQAGPGSGPCRARLGPVPGPARAPCRARLAPPGPGPRALPGPACHSRAEAPKSASRSRIEAGPARRKPARQTVLPGPVCGTSTGPLTHSRARAGGFAGPVLREAAGGPSRDKNDQRTGRLPENLSSNT